MIAENEFRLGRTCPTKILHARAGLARADEDDSFADWMRKETGKFRVVARYLFRDAVAVSPDTPEIAMEETLEHLAAGEPVADAVLATDQARCRVDAIEPDGAVLRLYTFIPKAVDLEKHRFGLEFTSQSGRLRREWREHLELAAFRVWVARQLCPQHRIVPLIVVPVTDVPCSVEGLHERFEKCDGRWQINDLRDVDEALGLLRIISVARECEQLVGAVAVQIEALNRFLAVPGDPEIGYQCKKCEFRVAGKESGFERCWGNLAKVRPHMFALTYLYFVQDPDGRPVADRLAREGRVSLWDIPREQIVGEHAARQHMQLAGTECGRELLMPELADALSGIVYPLRCLDIETLRSWLPAHGGQHVNELVCFEFSVHTRMAPGGPLEHVGWLNTERSDPNRRFLAALRATLGDSGTVCVWTQYEQVSFAELLGELIGRGVEGEDFEWLRRFLASGRCLDLHDICFRHHFHPKMGGRTSIKSVLPALWSVNTPVKRQAPYSEFPPDLDPYACLKESGTVSDGCLAMEGYLDVIGSDSEKSRAAREALERYCRVDTLAMFYVLDYWAWRLAGGRETGTTAGQGGTAS